jgi:NADH-quinone oxidoreductase subunit G
MYMSAATAWSHLVLPGTGYLERDGTTVNLEGRPQRLRRAVAPPGRFDELEFFAHLAGRFGLDIAPWPHVSAAERAPLPEAEAPAPLEAPALPAAAPVPESGFALVRYRPLFSGAAVERVAQLQFQRPVAEVELAYADARELGLRTGDPVTVRSNGTSRELAARLNRRLHRGVVRIAATHAEALGDTVELERAS